MTNHIGEATKKVVDLDALEKLADEATPGPWSAADWDDDFGENLFTVEASEPEVLKEGQSSIWPDGIRKMRVAETIEGQHPIEDAAFIAAANPATIKAMIAELKEARGLLSEWMGTWDIDASCRGIVPIADDTRAFLARNGKGEG